MKEALGVVVKGFVTVWTVIEKEAPGATATALIVSCRTEALDTVQVELMMQEQPVEEAREMEDGTVT